MKLLPKIVNAMGRMLKIFCKKKKNENEQERKEIK
jgi:hypothetical protein